MGASSSSLSVSSRVWIANDSFPEQEAKVYLPSDQGTLPECWLIFKHYDVYRHWSCIFWRRIAIGGRVSRISGNLNAIRSKQDPFIFSDYFIERIVVHDCQCYFTAEDPLCRLGGRLDDSSLHMAAVSYYRCAISGIDGGGWNVREGSESNYEFQSPAKAGEHRTCFFQHSLIGNV